MNDLASGHTIKKYDAELQKLEGRVLSMGKLVFQQLQGISHAVREDADYARDVIEGERAIDSLELKADKLIIKVIARRAPVGTDLRFLVAVSRMVADLETLGDEAVQMAKSILEGHGNRTDKNRLPAYEELDALTQLAAQMLQKAMTAFQELDLTAAKEVAFGNAGRDGELRTRLSGLTKSVMELDDTGQSVDLALTIRSLERITSSIRSIGEHIIYLVSNEDVRHQGKA